MNEIGDMPLDLQTKLLRALESLTISKVGSASEIKLDVGQSAPHKNLEQLVDKNLFRQIYSFD